MSDPQGVLLLIWICFHKEESHMKLILKDQEIVEEPVHGGAYVNSFNSIVCFSYDTRKKGN